MPSKTDASRLAEGEALVEPIEDENGRLRLDRRLTAAEIAEVEQRHRQSWLDGRAQSFGPPTEADAA